MGWLAAAASAIGGKVLDYGFDRASAQQAHQDTKEILQNRYQWQVQDMIKAGLNPMLSAGASPPGGAGPVVSRSMPFISSLQATSAIKVNNAQAELLKAQAETERNKPANVLASTEREVASAAQIRQETENLRATLGKIEAEIAGINAEIRKKGAETETLDRLRELDARLKALEAQERALRMPEAELRGEASQKVLTGDKATESTAEAIGHYIGGKAADLRDYISESISKWQSERERRGRELRKRREQGAK